MYRLEYKVVIVSSLGARCQDDICGLLRDHVGGKGKVGAWDFGEGRSINDTEPVDTADLEFTVKNSFLVIVRTNGAGARSVVAP